MCISRKHLDFMSGINDGHYKAGRIGYETYIRFAEHAGICQKCELLDNGTQGDIFNECRVRVLRYFVSAKRDDAARLTLLKHRGKVVTKAP
jgi:hypothetical protein